MELEASNLKGRNVLDSGGNLIGTVEDILFDPGTWTVEGILVGLKREAADDLNVRRSLGRDARLTLTRQRVGTIGDAVILNVNRDDLAGLLRRSVEGTGSAGAGVTGTERGTPPPR